MAGLAFQCKIIVCSAVAVAGKGSRAEPGDAGPDTVFVLLNCLWYCLPSALMGTREKKETSVNSYHFPNTSGGNFASIAPLMLNCKGRNRLSPSFYVGTLFSRTIFLVNVCLLYACETSMCSPAPVQDATFPV